MREIESVVVDSLESLLQEMVPNLGFQRHPIYRGQAVLDWKITPSLFRHELAKTPYKTWAEAEGCTLIQFKNRARAELRHEPTTELEWMALGAHNGLPARLSAWTENALVALFFASDPTHADQDGVVWRIMPGDTSLRVTQDYEQVPNRVQIYYPSHPDPSMRNQRACFLAHPLPQENATPECLEDIYKIGKDNFVLTQLVIPASAKDYLRRRLATVAIDNYYLFPSLSGLCLDLRDQIYYHTDAYEWIFPQ